MEVETNHNEDDIEIFNGLRTSNTHDLSENNLFCFTDSNIISFDTAQSNQHEIKEIENDIDIDDESTGDIEDVNEKFEDIMEFLEKTYYKEPPKKLLDMCKPTKMDFKSLRKMLKHKQQINSKQKNYSEKKIECIKKDNLMGNSCYNVQNQNNVLSKNVYIENVNGFNECKNSTTESCKEQKNGENDVLKHSEVIYESYTLKSYIFKYIIRNINPSYTDNLLKRLDDLEKTCDILDECCHDINNTYKLFNGCYDKKFIEELKKIYLTFDKNLSFNQETCEKYDKIFDSIFLHNKENYEFFLKLDLVDEKQKRLLFYSKLMKLYKYLTDVPEILTLGRFFSKLSFYKVFFMLHLIDLFDNVKDNVKDNRVFILCMIYTTSKYFYGEKKIDIFMIPKYKVTCTYTCEHDLYYFLWEFNSKKRRGIKSRNDCTLERSENDKKYLKAVFLLFLYQHSIFMKCFNVSVRYHDSFASFVHRVIRFESCYGCYLNEYLKRTQNFNKEIF